MQQQQPPFSGNLTLKSSDGRTFSVAAEAVAAKFSTIKNMVEDGCANGVIPVPDVDGKTLGAIMEWCMKHASFSSADSTRDEIRRWDAQFVKRLDKCRLHDIVRAADFLGGVELVDLVAGRLAGMMNVMTVEDIRGMFKLENYFTPEEEELLQGRITWKFV